MKRRAWPAVAASPPSTLALKLAKYAAVGKITLRNHFAYVLDFVIRSLFLLVILFIFVQLWTVTYAGVGTDQIAGYRFGEIIWYLIFAEAIIMASPKLNTTIEEEVKTGTVAYRLSRPLSYIGYHYVGYMGEALIRLVVNLVVGGLLGLAVIGPPQLGWGWAGFGLIVLGSFTINYFIRMSLSLCSFWLEETQGLAFVYDKLLFTVGGMMLPLELFPDALRAVCEWLPFQTIVYFAAKTAIHYDTGRLLSMLAVQCLWVAVLGLLTVGIYRKGVKMLHVNGG
ncbi:ABC-2 family transporter protein [Paenibacillus sp. J2TS4]|uniref:ABC transporter permease n=1 Tax=Paenibacillus sp. J2TS4 TaxID=2807194 RepID=UPI001B2393FE|nr:ABC-2 family transporter protein [Paenibacillus sp. J2TS4]GIP31222.1 ABC transporter permease [Paenibacillus sp. J2TS4]